MRTCPRDLILSVFLRASKQVLGVGNTLLCDRAPRGDLLRVDGWMEERV